MPNTILFLEAQGQPQTDDIGILNGVGREFLPSFKNPCWYEERKNNHELGKVAAYYISTTKPLLLSKCDYKRQSDMILRCLPYFFLIGQPKCATTDVFRRINLHPDVVEPIVKGPHWWTRKRYGPPYASRPVTFSEYLDVFNAPKIEENTRCDKTLHRWSNEKITGDGSTSTLWDSSSTMSYLYKIMSSDTQSISGKLFSRWHISHSVFEKTSGYVGMNTRHDPKSKNVIQNLQEVKYLQYYQYKDEVVLPFTVANVIHSVLPNSRIIAVIREPVSRLYSSYLFFTKKTSLSPETFDRNVKDSIQKWQDCTRQYSDRTCAYNKTLQNSLGVRLHNGLYSLFLRDWLKVFHKDQILVLRMEDYHQNVAETIISIYRHLGLRALTEEEEKVVNMAPVLNKNWKKPTIGKMLESTEKILKEFYKPYNRDLADLLKDSRYEWEDIYLKSEELNASHLTASSYA